MGCPTFNFILLFLAKAFLTTSMDVPKIDLSDVRPFNRLLLADHQPIPGEFLVQMNKASVRSQQQKDDAVGRLQTIRGLQVRDIFDIGEVQIFSISVQDEASMDEVSKLSDVAYIEPNKVMVAFECAPESHPDMWGLDRIDQRGPLPYTIDNTSTAVYNHSSTDGDGQGVDVYVLDTGIKINHPEFGNRASHGYTASNIFEGNDDLNGHGTHVAGTIGSITYGVAKAAHIVAVKVLDQDGSGSYSGSIEGLNWVLRAHNDKQQATGHAGKWPKSVINMSLGGPQSAMFDNVMREVIDGGITVVVSAGNDAADACESSPASVEEAITVGSVGISDESSYFTNWGSCVDVFAPGEYIASIDAISGGVAVYQGTSMAAPHVAGVVARYMSLLDDSPTPETMKDFIIDKSTNNAIQYPNSSPNKLLYVDCDAPGSDVLPFIPATDKPSTTIPGRPSTTIHDRPSTTIHDRPSTTIPRRPRRPRRPSYPGNGSDNLSKGYRGLVFCSAMATLVSVYILH